MRRNRSLTRQEQWELLALLGVLVLGFVALAAAWRLGSASGLAAFAVRPEAGAHASAQSLLPQAVNAVSADDSADDPVQVVDSADDDAAAPAQSVPALVKPLVRSLIIPPYPPQFGPDAQPRHIAPKPRPQPEIHWFHGKRYKYVRTIRMRVTAYAPDKRCCWPYDGTTTASGLPVETNGGRLVAADTRIVPLHWMVAVPGYHASQPVPVLDRGGAIKGHRLDVLLPSFSAAKEWGSRIINVKIYKPLDD